MSQRNRITAVPETLEARRLLAAQLYISEFLAINNTGAADNFGQRSDWIEIHNAGDAPVNLQGYHLTDERDNLAQWTFPPIVLPAQEHLVVWASGTSRRDPAAPLHAGFALDGAGEFLALVAPDGLVAHKYDPYPAQLADRSYGLLFTPETSAVVGPAAPATAKVPTGAPQEAGWANVGFDDSSWQRGATGVGYDAAASPTYTQLIGSDVRASMHNANASAYVRVPFTLNPDDPQNPDSGPPRFDLLRLRMKYDDGFVAYLNGAEVARRNAPGTPGAPLPHNAAAAADRPNAQAVVFESILIDQSAPRAGDNVLAIHGLNSSAGDADFLALPELDGVVTHVSPERYLAPPTPGASNSTSQIVEVVEDTKFSHDRGFYDAPFNLTIRTSTPGAQIRYTTNGTPPTATTGTVYGGPIPINGTSVVRAAAFKPGAVSTNVDTQTYVFVADVPLQTYQSTLDAGFPAAWGTVAPDYGMDPDVVGPGDRFNGVYAASIRNDLKSVPTLSIVTKTEDMFGSNGIYTHSTQSGPLWERPTSVELIYPDGTQGFQIDAGIQIQGGAFRSHNLTKKHGMRLSFKNIYGAGKLEFPLFGDGAADEFDHITLRADSNDGWQWGGAGGQPLYSRDEFGRRTQPRDGPPRLPRRPRPRLHQRRLLGHLQQRRAPGRLFRGELLRRGQGQLGRAQPRHPRRRRPRGVERHAGADRPGPLRPHRGRPHRGLPEAPGQQSRRHPQPRLPGLPRRGQPHRLHDREPVRRQHRLAAQQLVGRPRPQARQHRVQVLHVGRGVDAEPALHRRHQPHGRQPGAGVAVLEAPGERGVPHAVRGPPPEALLQRRRSLRRPRESRLGPGAAAAQRARRPVRPDH